MANAIVEAFTGITGLTLTLDLFPLGSDTAVVSALSLTEATNRKGLYTGTTSAGLTGLHQALVKNGSNVVYIGIVYMTDDTSIHRILEQAASLYLGGTIELSTDSLNAIADALLKRNVSNVEATAGEHTLCTIVLAMLENSISGATLTIKRTDGTTTHVTKTLSTDASADPITGIS